MKNLNIMVLWAFCGVLFFIGCIFIGISTARGGNTDWSNLGFYGWTGFIFLIVSIVGIPASKLFIKNKDN